MSVRKSYQVLVSGDPIFSGSFSSCSFVYDAILSLASLKSLDLDVLIAFKKG